MSKTIILENSRNFTCTNNFVWMTTRRSCVHPWTLWKLTKMCEEEDQTFYDVASGLDRLTTKLEYEDVY